MKKIIREIKKNVYRMYFKPTSDDIAAVIIFSFAIGTVFMSLMK